MKRKRRNPSPQESARPRWENPLLLDLSLFVLALAVYLPTLGGQFLWDDNAWVVNNESLRSLGGLLRSWHDLKHLPAYPYYPLLNTSFWIDHQIWGLNPFGYRLTNVLLHAGCAVLVRRSLAHLRVPGAWLAAALFVAHPVQLESVAWITERKNTLSGIFYLAALLTYLRFAPPGEGRIARARTRRYLLFLFLALCALLAKTVTVTLAGTIVALCWWKEGRIELRRLLHVGPVVAMGLPLALLTSWLEKTVIGASGSDFTLSFWQKIVVSGHGFWFYLGKLVWPVPLAFVYPRWEIDDHLGTQLLFPLAAVGLFVGLWLARGRVGRGPLAALLHFALTLFPALGFFNVWAHLNSFVADHWQYLASIGPFALAAALAAEGRARLTGTPRVAAGVALGLVLALLGNVGWREGEKYQSLDRLWRDTLAKNPGSWMVQNNLGTLLARDGKVKEAIPYLERGVALAPDQRRATMLSDLGRALTVAGSTREAIERLEEAVRRDPRHLVARHNLGLAYAQVGATAAAAAQLEAALRLNPRFSMAHSALGFIYLRQHKPELGSRHFERALEADPGNIEAHVGEGDVAMLRHRARRALEHYELALRLTTGGTDPRLVRLIRKKAADARRTARGAPQDYTP